MPSMVSYLISGCSRGIGLEMVKQLTSRSAAAGATIFATSRAPEPSQALKALTDSNKHIHYVQLDTEDKQSISTAVTRVTSLLGNDGLDVLINNAGIQIREPDRTPGLTALEKTLMANVVAVDTVTAAFLPLLREGQKKQIVNITSTLGSIGKVNQFAMSPCPSYKISKTALNMLTVQYSMDLKKEGFIAVVISPGWLKTDLGGSYADLEPEVGVAKVLDIIDGLTEKDNGAFRDIHVPGHDTYPGTNPPW